MNLTVNNQTNFNLQPQFPTCYVELINALSQKFKVPWETAEVSVLSAMSASIHGFVDVETYYFKTIPTSLFTLAMAESGDRKSTIDAAVYAPIREYAIERIEFQKDLYTIYAAELAVWNSINRKLNSNAAKAFDDEDFEYFEELKQQILEHHENKPEEPASQTIVITEATTAALTHEMRGENRYCTLLSSEASQMFSRTNYNFASALSEFWDGNNYVNIARKTGNTQVINGRLSIAAMIQPALIKDLVSKKQNALRLSGLLSRMLIVAPPSMQGYRDSTPISDDANRHIDLFLKRISHNIRLTDAYLANGKKLVIKLSPQARQIFSDFQQLLEGELSFHGALFDVRDAASKAVENAIRISANLAVISNGIDNLEEISGEIAFCSCHIKMRFLHSFKSLFGFKTAQEIAEEYANTLRKFFFKKSITPYTEYTTSWLMQCGPSSVRSKYALQMALNVLYNNGEINIVTRDNQTLVQVDINRLRQPYEASLSI